MHYCIASSSLRTASARKYCTAASIIALTISIATNIIICILQQAIALTIYLHHIFTCHCTVICHRHHHRSNIIAAPPPPFIAPSPTIPPLLIAIVPFITTRPHHHRIATTIPAHPSPTISSLSPFTAIATAHIHRIVIVRHSPSSFQHHHRAIIITIITSIHSFTARLTPSSPSPGTIIAPSPIAIHSPSFIIRRTARRHRVVIIGIAVTIAHRHRHTAPVHHPHHHTAHRRHQHHRPPSAPPSAITVGTVTVITCTSFIAHHRSPFNIITVHHRPFGHSPAPPSFIAFVVWPAVITSPSARHRPLAPPSHQFVTHDIAPPPSFIITSSTSAPSSSFIAPAPPFTIAHHATPFHHSPSPFHHHLVPPFIALPPPSSPVHIIHSRLSLALTN